jgi:hypothetical protein
MSRKRDMNQTNQKQTFQKVIFIHTVRLFGKGIDILEFLHKSNILALADPMGKESYW